MQYAAMTNSFISLADCYVAYRKAKSEAFYESTHFHALAFATYEKNLRRNLEGLWQRLKSGSAWTTDVKSIGGFVYAPKSIESGPEDETEMYFRHLDPLEEWKRRFISSNSSRLKANFRLVITPTVDFQIISALWIIKAGYLFDLCLSKTACFGNRLRMQRSHATEKVGNTRSLTLNLDCMGLFQPYIFLYRAWREGGLKAIRDALAAGDHVVALTMDVEKFYHRVNPAFLVRPEFQSALGVSLTSEQQNFTSLLLDAISHWYAQTPDSGERPEGALPVGLSASKVIANALLGEFDKQFVQNVKPRYYGRYVDDLFVVMRTSSEISSGSDVMRLLVNAMPDHFRLQENTSSAASLVLSLPYARDSELVFSGAKQKVFYLAAEFGGDLVAQITEQIRKNSSEHRLLPILPDTAETMASRALLAQPHASLEADALRKADVISVRRLGVALLLRDLECYCRELPSSQWKERRLQFYGLVNRHVVTPQGFFEFFGYTHRVFGLMIACGDSEAASALMRRLVATINMLAATTTAGTTEELKFHLCRKYYAKALVQTALQASTVARFHWDKSFLRTLDEIRSVDSATELPKDLRAARVLSSDLFYSDFGRRPYRESWLSGAKRERENPEVPRSIGLRRLFRLGAIRTFRKQAGLLTPYWPAVVFPTRPLGLSEITAAAPELLHHAALLRAALFAMRGSRAKIHDGFGLNGPSRPLGAPELVVKAAAKDRLQIAIPSFFTDEADLTSALAGRPRLTLVRYERIRRMVNRMCEQSPRPEYIVFPECSLPRAWATGIAHMLSKQRISLIAGLEYKVTPKGVRNDALVSLTTDWPWFNSSVQYTQPKRAPAHDERRRLKATGNKPLYKPRHELLPVYVHGTFFFGVLICSDLTTPSNRVGYQGAVDALFVLEWNSDIETFSFLVEATAHDLHAYIVQVNNRQFGDSRVRVARKISHERDVVRIRGGFADYFVIAELNVRALREFHKRPTSGKDAPFKPLPIGFTMSPSRAAS